MIKLLLIFLGFTLMVSGINYIIIYINLFSFGYTIKEYLEFLYTTPEGYLLPIGLLLETIGIFMRKDKNK